MDCYIPYCYYYLLIGSYWLCYSYSAIGYSSHTVGAAFTTGEFADFYV